jgi:hypothetical protein
MEFTPLLRAAYPDRFSFTSTPLGDGGVALFTDPDNRAVVVEVGDQQYLLDLVARGVPGLEAATLAAPSTSVPVAEASSTSPVDPVTAEGAFFGSRIVNLPNGKGLDRGNVEFLIGHRFSQPLFTSSSPAGLFGLDSSATVTFGAQVGLTDWLSVSAMRSNLDRTIEVASALQISRQDDRGPAPLSTQFRIGVEGRDNLRERFAPFMQFVAARSFGDRFSLAVAPGVAFNTFNEDTFFPADLLFDEDHDYTASIGLGAGLRVLPTVSVVAEYVPRVAGFKGELFDRPAVSVGIQKATFRHTFEFVISTARPLTTAQYMVNGTDTFKVGFNIYRRLR